MAVLEGDVQPVEVKAETPSKRAKKKNGSREAGRAGEKWNMRRPEDCFLA